MKNILGYGEHRYRVVENWAKLPDGWQLTDVASVGVDSKDRIYVFNRGEHPMIVLDRDGNFIRSFGEEQELRNMYTRTAQAGLYFIAGSLAQCRINSKYLALQIKAIEEGLMQ